MLCGPLASPFPVTSCWALARVPTGSALALAPLHISLPPVCLSVCLSFPRGQGHRHGSIRALTGERGRGPVQTPGDGWPPQEPAPRLPGQRQGGARVEAAAHRAALRPAPPEPHGHGGARRGHGDGRCKLSPSFSSSLHLLVLSLKRGDTGSPHAALSPERHVCWARGWQRDGAGDGTGAAANWFWQKTSWDQSGAPTLLPP